MHLIKPFFTNIIDRQESETLEAQNRTLKSEIDRLEGEKKRLMDMLSAHDPTCAKRFKEMTTEAPLDQGEDLLDWLCKSDFTQPMTKIDQPTLPYVLRQLHFFSLAIGARARISPEASNQHFRVPAAPMTSSTSKRPPAPPSLDSVQNSYGFGYSGQDVKTEGERPHRQMLRESHGLLHQPPWSDIATSMPVHLKLNQTFAGASSSHLVMEVDHHHGDGANLEQGYLSSRNVNSCGFPDPSTSSAPGHFLGQSIEWLIHY